MRFVFIRHGHYEHPSDRAAKVRASLTCEGRAAAREAGEFLRAHGIVPDVAWRTPPERTRETLAIVLEVLEAACPLRVSAHGFARSASAVEIGARVDGWAGDRGPAGCDLVFVGHGEQQVALLRELGGPAVPRRNRATVLVYDRDAAGEWIVGPCFVGR